MSLLLTKSCEYALLVTIQQGRYFKSDNESIQVETELDLKLPSSINDLIPHNTKITSPSANIERDGTCDFNVSLVYFVSSKQLVRLRKERAKAIIRTRRIYKDQKMKLVDTIQLPITEAKEVVPKSAHQLDHIYKFVADKGAWCTLSSQEQLKVGLFYVAMPDSSNSGGGGGGTITRVSTPCIELRSPPPTPKITNAALHQSYCSSNSSSGNSSTTTSSNRKKKITSILGMQHQLPKKKPVEDKRAKTPQPTLRRTKSSLIDLNIEELAETLRKINIFPSVSKEIRKTPQPSQSYHQIGKGTLKYTFYFKILHADHINPSISHSSNSKLKKPYVSWSFLSTYNISPAASFAQEYTNQSRSCFQLTGHLVDIQHWLDALDQIKLSLIMMDKQTKQTAGTASISLKNIAFNDRTFDDRSCLVLNSQDQVVAQITVRMGLVSGWHQENQLEINDRWEETGQKKMRHSSQSSIPTLISSSSSKSTTPTVHYVNPFVRPTSSITSYFRNKRKEAIK
ncbi:hypothetical protein G6F56_003815 [Rhizopus delemar]|nr:hypothetical protein G6F56_003815 [Rhizopus delemar]